MSSIVTTIKNVLGSIQGDATQAKMAQHRDIMLGEFTEEGMTSVTQEAKAQLMVEATENVHVPGIEVTRFLARGSLGLVYLGTLSSDPDTQVVAKVLDPSRVSATQRELKAVQHIGKVLSWVAPSAGPATITFGDAVLRELDYMQELSFQQRIYDWFRDDPIVIIPRPFREHCDNTTLVSEFVNMVPLYSMPLELLSPEAVGRIGDALVRFQARLNHKHQFIYADLSPGNVLVDRDGNVAVVDFGCCSQMTKQEYIDTVAVSDASSGTFEFYVRNHDRFHVSQDISVLEELWRFTHVQSRPYSPEYAGQFTKEWFRTLSQNVPTRTAMGTKVHPQCTLQLRSFYGLSSILVHLGYRGNPAKISSEERRAACAVHGLVSPEPVHGVKGRQADPVCVFQSSTDM